jgi:hypothetical protein
VNNLVKALLQIQVCVVLFEVKGSPHGSPSTTTIAAGYIEEDYEHES